MEKPQETINGLLDGKIKAPNELVQHYVDELKKLKTYANGVAEKYTRVRKQLTELEKELLKIEGKKDAIVESLVSFWDKAHAPRVVPATKQQVAAIKKGA